MVPPSYEENNRRYWNEITPVHARAEDFYGLEAFKRGQSMLCREEIEEVGPVAGKKLLHLQCHFGLDTLSWARLGAEVTGVDISDASIELARSIAQETGLDARFIRSDIYDLDSVLKEEFDIVYTGRGALVWLRDLEQWARLVAARLKPGGLLYLMDSHPSLDLFYEQVPGEMKVNHSYFHTPEPEAGKGGEEADYADKDYFPAARSFGWNWTLSEIINAIVGAGMRLEKLSEYDRFFCSIFPGMVREEFGWWSLPGFEGKIPMTFALSARRGN